MIDAEALHPRQPSSTGSHELISPFSPQDQILTDLASTTQAARLPCDEQGLCGYNLPSHTYCGALPSYNPFSSLVLELHSPYRLFDVAGSLRRSSVAPTSEVLVPCGLNIDRDTGQSAEVTRLNAYQFLLHNEHTITASRSTSFVLFRSSANSSLDCGSVLEMIWIRSASRSYPRLLREPQTRNIAMPASLEQDASHPRKLFEDLRRLQFLQNRFSPL
ncbi:hypothetical protein BJX62DRAFT_25982 [Aspergillus germanicus]